MSSTTNTEKAVEDGKETAKNIAEDARETASNVYHDASNAARQQADSVKSSFADEVSNVASALRKAADEMRDGSPQERSFGQIAESLADASESMRDKDLGQISGDVSNFARNNPLVFLGGAALIGFAATRFAKASSETSRDTKAITDGGETL